MSSSSRSNSSLKIPKGKKLYCFRKASDTQRQLELERYRQEKRQGKKTNG